MLSTATRLGTAIQKHSRGFKPYRGRYNKTKQMKVAVEGCCHGQLDAIYDHIQSLETRNDYKVDLLLICGDFQAIRNYSDLQCMAVPNKYKELGGFHRYYTGEKSAPILTIVIGGNHEASNYMWELYHGGWVAPNIYFLGHAGCVQVNGIRIVGASGIFKTHDFRLGNHERLPYSPSSMRSIYHIREFNVRRLSLLSQPTVFLSHDWPQSIEHHGDLRGLLSRKSFLRQDINTGNLGSPPLMGLLRTLKPLWWFAAHLHTRYEAAVVHEPGPGIAVEDVQQKQVMVKNPDEIVIDDDEDLESEIKEEREVAEVKQLSPRVQSQILPVGERNPDEITLDDEEDAVEPPPPVDPVPALTAQVTQFLALDKCLPKRQFLEVVDIPTPRQPDPSSRSQEGNHESSSLTPIPRLDFDPEWLAITRAFHPWFSTTYQQPPFPDEAEARELVTKAKEWVVEHLQKNDPSCPLPVHEIQTFTCTAPGPTPSSLSRNISYDKEPQPPAYSNPQTEAFCHMLEVENKIYPSASGGGSGTSGIASPK